MKRKMRSTPVGRMELAPDALSGQVAGVVGGDQPIGREISVAFARLGARVVVAGASAAAQETARIVEAGGGEGLFVEADCADEADVARLAHRTQEVFGPADILVHSASVRPVAPVIDLDVALWDRVIAANLRAAFLTCKAFLPQMLPRGRGTIVNVVSMGAEPFLSAYAASQRGVVGFTRSLAAEAGPQGVHVVAFAPGAAIPADHAAVAVAFLVVALAHEYHGQQVDAETVLGRAGLTAALGSGGEPPVPVVEPTPALAAGRPEVVRRATILSERLQDAIAETEAEFAQLPDFVRPLARDGFESMAGQRIEDWSDTAADLTNRLKHMAGAGRVAGSGSRVDYSRLKPLFDGLMRYYRETPSEAACFTTDADSVAQVREVMREREGVVRSLLAALETIAHEIESLAE
jgi:3-oxoacyl-[acyl-carrier protein] reductase